MVTVDDGRHEDLPQGLKPASVADFIAKAEAFAYLEAKTFWMAMDFF